MSQKRQKTIPGPKGMPILGMAPEMRRDSLGLVIKLMLEYGDIVKLPLPGIRGHLINEPELIKILLTETEKNNYKDKMYDRLKPTLGEGLVTSKGELWKRQRLLSNPAFNPKMVAGFDEAIAGCIEEMLFSWEKNFSGGKNFDICSEMMKLTFSIVIKTLFSSDLNLNSHRVAKCLHEFQEYSTHLFWTALPLPLSLPLPRHIRFKRARSEMDKIIYQVIEERRKNPAKDGRKDLLQMFMSAVGEENGEKMDNQQLRDEVLTMMLAGHDTTANALSFTFFLLSQNPQVLRKVEEEVERVFSGLRPKMEEVPKLTYTRMVFEESMRLYPPAWMINRTSMKDLEFQGYFFPAGSTFFLSQFSTHRNPRHWENPEGFDPERFSPENSATRHKFAYFPFGGGPRFCIGMNLAMMEGLLILATVLQKNRLYNLPGDKFQLSPRITLGPRPGIQMYLQRRSPLEILGH